MTPEDIYHDLDPETARIQLMDLAKGGDHEAEFYLGHLADEESPRDPAHALDWYRKSAAGGFLEARHWMASFMYHGMGTSQDVPAAVAIFRECAGAGLDASCWALGQHLLQDPGNRNEAIHWLKLAAGMNHSGAIELLREQEGRDVNQAV